MITDRQTDRHTHRQTDTISTILRSLIGGGLTAKFDYRGPTGPDQTKSADFVGDPGLR